MDIELLARNVAAHWLQAGVLAVSALLAARLLNFNDPRAKLAALQLTLVAIVLLPIVQSRRVELRTIETAATAIVVNDAPLSESASGGSISAVSSPDPSLALVLIVAAGIALRLVWLLYGVVRLARFSSQTPPVLPPAVAGPIEAHLNVSPRYIQQTGSRGPWTFGFLKPTVALPAAFDTLVPAFQRAMVCHELMHIKRRDIVIAFCEEIAVAALWFHPWAWLLRARIRVAREQAVDSRVVALLGNRDEYVRCLVDISGHDLAPHFSQAGAGMLRPHELRARVDAIFAEAHMSRTRLALAALAFIVVTFATGLIATAAMPLRQSEVPQYVLSGFSTAEPLAKAVSPTLPAPPQATPSQNAPEAPRKQINKSYPEYPQDALERGIRGTVIVDVTVNAAGDVSTAAVASGPQELRASAFTAALGLKFTPGRSTTVMKIAVDYTLTGNSWGVRIGEARPHIATWSSVTRSDGVDATNSTNLSPDATGAYRIGGGLRPPKKIKDVPPEYPAIAQQARVQGVVILEARIDERGNITDARPLRSIPLLDQAAIDAVKQWQYEPTLMNGVAVPIIMTVTVNFALRDSPPRGIVRMNIALPEDITTAPHTTQLAVRANDIGMVVTDKMTFGFTPLLHEDPSGATVKIAIYRMTPNLSAPPEVLGSVVAAPGGSIVYSGTTPSFGIQVLSVEQP
jgi:TonB family protein